MYETGCYVDGHNGQYGVLRVIEMAEAEGFVVDDPNHKSLDYEWIYELGDDAENYLNENVAEEGYSFGWYDGEFYYWTIEQWEDN